MLVIQRLPEESFTITAGDKKIVVQVIRVMGQKVRLGIEAPADVKVLRDELITRA